MLIQLTRQMRIRAAIALAVVYSFCLIFPPVAFAFSDGKLATHCLGMALDRADSSNINRDQGAPHDHAAMHHADMQHVGSQDAPVVAPLDASLVSSFGASHHDDDREHRTKHVGSCCGLFCSLAVATNLQSVGRQDNFASEVVRACEESLAGRGPSRIDRPPSTTLMSS